MIALVYSAACLGFCLAFRALGILARSRAEMARLWSEMSALRDPGLTDDDKERLARRAAVRAMSGSGALVLRLAALGLAAFAPVWLADIAGLAAAQEVTDFALRLDVLIGTTAVVGVLAAVLHWRRRA